MVRQIFFTTIVSTFLSACSSTAGVHRPMLVEVWKGGDDALTNRFAAALEQEFREDRRFRLTEGGKTKMLKVTIVTGLRREMRDGKVEAHYLVEVAPLAGATHLSTGSCFEDSLQTCAGSVKMDVLTTRR
jgi:hypothetical protein